jgi:LysM repeat protein
VKPKPKLVKYTVKKGDSLGRIASKHGIGLSSLRRANGISGDLIRPGQVLKIPK